MEAMQRRLSALPGHSAVLFTTVFYYDAAGQYFMPDEALAGISSRSTAPVFTGSDEVFLGSGIVGGVLYDLTPTADATGRIAQRVLAGEKPASIPVETLNPNRPMFDARQLERWSIPIPAAGWKRDQIRGNRDLGQIQALHRRDRGVGRVPGGAHSRPDRDERQAAARRNLASREPCTDSRGVSRPPDHRSGTGAVANRTGTARRCLSTDGADRDGVDAPGKECCPMVPSTRERK